MKAKLRNKASSADAVDKARQTVSFGKSYGEQSFNNAPLSRERYNVLLIHGRDELNALRLIRLVQDRWHCGVITSRDTPAQGRTVIEKFEQMSSDVVAAIVLLTPDDFVNYEGVDYHQARPNVLFELGWIYARLGRNRVSILVRRGTHLPSDLDGINIITFRESVLEVAQQLQSELQATGMLKSA